MTVGHSTQDAQLLPGLEWLYLAQALAERKQVCEVLTQNQELLKQMEGN
jgi:hypothetical protein